MSERHQCLIYEGSPFLHIEAVAACFTRQLHENQCCLYINNEAMIEALRIRLAANGVDVIKECSKGSLLFSAEKAHLDRRKSFNTERMLCHLEQALEQALQDGYTGLFASGDVAWEFGPKKDFAELFEYEWRLERFVRDHPQISGICQYHLGSLPREALRTGAIVHETIFVDEALSVPNPNYILAKKAAESNVRTGRRLERGDRFSS